MYDYVEGELVSKRPAQVVLETGGVGYRFTVPLSTSDVLPDGGRVKLFAYLHIRDEELRLYGFATEDERSLFLRLTAVSNIGPGTALTVLSGMTVNDFRRAVAREDLPALCRVKGIGRKTAERIVVELRAQMQRELVELPPEGLRASALVSDAVAAMLALGYRRSDSEKAVRRALDRLGAKANLEELVRAALQQV